MYILNDYECSKCGEVKEEFSDMEPLYCSKDHRPELMNKKTSAPKSLFKGTGFYETDYKKKS